MPNKFVAPSVYQKNVVDHMEGTKKLKELELCEELSEEEMIGIVGGKTITVSNNRDSGSYYMSFYPDVKNSPQ
jgi:hypothetical protein